MVKDFRELSFSEIGKWPAYMQAIVIGLVAFIIIVLAYWFVGRGQFDRLSGVKSEEASLKQQLEVKHHTLARLEQLQVHTLVLQKTFQQIINSLPDQTQVPALLEQISKFGTTNGLSFKLLRPLKKQYQDYYAEIPIKIVVVGGYHQVANFISDIAGADHFVSFHEFIIQNEALNKQLKDKVSDGSKLEMELTAVIYHTVKAQRES